MSINLSALMKQRYDTAANWTAQNPTLLAGEIGIESDTKKWKVGTGSTAWTSLAYAIGGTYPIVNADIAAGAEIAVSKLADGSARQLLQTDAAGTGVEWTSDVSIPGVLAVTAGTAALPGIAVSGDPNTGIYSPGADQLAISTGGTGRLFVDASGNVGVGIVPRDQYSYYRVLEFDSGFVASSLPFTFTTFSFYGNNYRVASDGRQRYLSDYGFAAGAYSQQNGAHNFFASRGGTASPTSVASFVTTSDTRYTVTTLGSTTLAQWQVLFSGLTALPSVGQTITATASGTLGGTPAGTFTQLVILNQRLSISQAGTTTLSAAAATAPFIATIGGGEVTRIDGSGRLLVGGSSDSGGALLQVFGDRIRIGTAKTPASATATGTAGEICWDANYIYVCTATNTWKRTAIATW